MHAHAWLHLIWPLVFSSRGRKTLRQLIILPSCCTHERATGSRLRDRKKKGLRYEVVVGGRSITGLLKINLLMATSVLREMGETAAGTEGCLCYLGAAMTVCSHKPVCSESLLLLPMPELWRVREVWRGWLPVRLHSNRLLRGKLHCS